MAAKGALVFAGSGAGKVTIHPSWKSSMAQSWAALSK